MNLKEELKDPIFRIIGETADEIGREVYLVGGFVRDIFLKRPSHDMDFVTVGSGIELAERIARKLGRRSQLAVYASYGTAMVKHFGYELEFVGARKESYNRDSRNPIVENGTMEDDQKRRDFTVNDMAVCLNISRFGELVDPYGGLDDLNNKIIRTPLDPDITFSDDPLRMMRAVRFASQLNFSIYPETLEAIKRNAPRIEIITRERIKDELAKILGSPQPSVGLSLLEVTGLMDLIFPELSALKGVETKEGKGHKDNFLHTLQVVDNVAAKTDNVWLRWAALLHDVGKPVTKKYEPGQGWTFHNHNFIGEKMVSRIFRKMKLPLNDKMRYVEKLVGMHMRPQSVGEEGVTDSAVRRMITDAGEDLDDLMLLAEADITSKNPEKVRRILKNFTEVRERVKEVMAKDDYRNWKNPVNGHMLMEMYPGIDGVEIGKIKQMVKDAIMDGKVEYNLPSSLRFVESLKGKPAKSFLNDCENEDGN